ncbi:MAG TPA: VOC family protein [Chitinophagaceae bacterium]|nr:VOC family protein [Chitinophagaceae bacterium]
MHTISPGLTYHHTAILVKDIQAGITAYKEVFGEAAISPVFPISSQQVYVCFVNTGSGAHLELVQPFLESNAFDAYFKRNIQYYHIAYTTPAFDSTIQQLTSGNYKLINTFNSEAFNNRRCAFLVSGLAHLIEIIET